MKITPESVAADYRRMAESARQHGRLTWAEHWTACAERVERTRKLRLTPAEFSRARLEQAAFLTDLMRATPPAHNRTVRRGRRVHRAA